MGGTKGIKGIKGGRRGTDRRRACIGRFGLWCIGAPWWVVVVVVGWW